jgi:6-phosphogluconolactonase/glucosamine-6-phosphate isomerase/deaminase
MFEGRATGPADSPNVWFCKAAGQTQPLADRQVHAIEPTVLESEAAVGEAMLARLQRVAEDKTESSGPDSPVTIALLGGRGAQAMHKLLGARVAENPDDPLIRRLVVFTQDALAPLPMASPLSFVRDFERLMGVAFFQRVRRFIPFETERLSPEASTLRSLDALQEAGGLDIFFLGHGPEANAASHLAYIKPGSGARITDWGGAIPISQSILEHHISKFKAGGSKVSVEDEAKCRAARHILTLGPAAILGAKHIVQGVVDADTAPAKKQSYRRVMETSLSNDADERARQLDENPGLWIRLHPSVKSFVLPNVLE